MTCCSLSLTILCGIKLRVEQSLQGPDLNIVPPSLSWFTSILCFPGIILPRHCFARPELDRFPGIIPSRHCFARLELDRSYYFRDLLHRFTAWKSGKKAGGNYSLSRYPVAEADLEVRQTTEEESKTVIIF